MVSPRSRRSDSEPRPAANAKSTLAKILQPTAGEWSRPHVAPREMVKTVRAHCRRAAMCIPRLCDSRSGLPAISSRLLGLEDPVPPEKRGDARGKRGTRPIFAAQIYLMHGFRELTKARPSTSMPDSPSAAVFECRKIATWPISIQRSRTHDHRRSAPCIIPCVCDMPNFPCLSSLIHGATGLRSLRRAISRLLHHPLTARIGPTQRDVAKLTSTGTTWFDLRRIGDAVVPRRFRDSDVRSSDFCSLIRHDWIRPRIFPARQRVVRPPEIYPRPRQAAPGHLAFASFLVGRRPQRR